MSPRTSKRPLFVVLLVAWSATGCWKISADPIVNGDGDSDVDVDVDSDSDGDPPLSRSVDLLVVVDNSGSMAQEQAALSQSFGLLVDSLADPPDTDGNGRPDYRRVEDLHVGVISTDMGTGGYAVTTCEDVVDGDDGILQNTAWRDLVPGCEAEYPRFLEWTRGDDPEDLDRDFQCIATLGTGGCGFEQQLKAVRKALTDHAAGANEGFVRDDSLLAILMVTDEEDCSIREDMRNATDIFNTQLQLGPLNLRCFNHRQKYVAPVEEYVDALLGLRGDYPSRVIVTGIVGIPPDAECNLYDMRPDDFQCLLDLPRMQEVVDNSPDGQGERLTPSCDVQGMGEAFPPRRIIELMRQVAERGGGANAQSICKADWTAPIQAIAQSIGTRLR